MQQKSDNRIFVSENLRIIPRMDIKGINVVKGIHMEGLRVISNPVELATQYYADGADEILYLDIVASLYQRNFDFELLQKVSHDIFIPFTVGGGIRSIDDVRNALRVGADKVAINTAAVKNPKLLKEAVHVFGSQCIVLYIEAKRKYDGTWEAYTDGGREKTGVNVKEWVLQGIKLGVGEILLSSIDTDGTRRGYDIELIQEIAPLVPVPLIVHGGGWTKNMSLEVLKVGAIDALAASSMFHYDEVSISNLKHYLHDNGLNIRLL